MKNLQKKYRICSIIDNEFVCSGVNAYWKSLANLLISQGHEVTTFVLSHDSLEWDEAVYRLIPGNIIKISYSKHGGDLDITLRKFIEKYDPHIIIHHYSDIGLDVATSSERRGWKNVYVCHSDDPIHYHRSLKRANELEAIIAVSGICGEYLIHKGLPPHKIFHIPYSITRSAHETIPKRDKKIHLIYAGRLEEYQKRSMDLVRLIDLMERDNIPYQLTVAGSGSLLNEMERNLAEQVRNGKVRFAGFLNEKELHETLNEHEIFLNFSNFEGLSTSLVKAMSCGCFPVISRTKSGVHFLNEGKDALFFDAGDIARCARHIQQLSMDKTHLYELRVNSMRTIHHYFDPKHLVENVAKFIDQVMKTEKAGRPLLSKLKKIFYR